jgi:hypothetical protein
VTRVAWIVVLAAVLAARSATLAAQEPAPDEVQRIARAQPADPQACLAMANRCWSPSVAQPLFDCWAATASREDLIRQAASGGWAVRALALHALTHAPTSPVSLLRGSPGAAPLIEWSIAPTLVRSLVELLAHDVSASPAPNAISHETARLARDALWDLSDRNMTVALEYADQIRPISRRQMSAGRFGASHDLASKDAQAYAARRRAWQMLIAGALATFFATLRIVKAARAVATAMLAAVVMWAAWFSFQTDVRELPPPPLMFLTASCLAFVSAGLLSGVMVRFRSRGWQRVAAAAPAAAVGAFLLCAGTRAAGLFPISDGSRLMFEPAGSALLAAAAGAAISAVLAIEARFSDA